MPNSPECQPIADAMAALVAQEQARLAALAALDGVAKWQAMLDLGTIRQQIAEQGRELRELRTAGKHTMK